MALTVDFSTSQSPGSPGNILFTDLSIGTDGTITQRRIYISDYQGNFLVPSGISTQYNTWMNFPSSTTITLSNILDKDYGAKVVVQWLTAGGTVVYDKTKYIGFNCYNSDFDYQLTQNVASNQLLMNDNGFWYKKDLLQTLITSGDNAISRATDINAAQQVYDAATEMRLDAQYWFNQNS